MEGRGWNQPLKEKLDDFNIAKCAGVRDEYRGGAKTCNSTTLASALSPGPVAVLVTKVSCFLLKRGMSLAFNCRLVFPLKEA